MRQVRVISELNDFKNKTVLVRIDADVDVENGKVVDDTRLESSVETIKYILEKSGKVMLVGHRGRPKQKFKVPARLASMPAGQVERGSLDESVAGRQNSKFKIDESLSLKEVAEWFKNKFKRQNSKGKIVEKDINESYFGDFPGWEITSSLWMLENIRFYEGEEDLLTASNAAVASSGLEFVKALAGLGDLFVNEAFAVSHREHGSVVGITKFLPSYAGLHLVREVEVLGKLLEDPLRPLVVIIGGAKIETKLPLVEKMHGFADYVLVGGEIAEQERVLLKVQHEKVSDRKSVLLVADLREDGKDITEKAAENFIQIINTAKTVVWNGPVGQVQSSKFKVQSFENDSEEGTRKIAEAIVKSEAYKIVGGGDTVEFLRKEGLLDKFSFVSVGGGAMLEFLSGKKLPGLIPLIF